MTWHGRIMKKYKFDAHGHNAPAYSCAQPGDNSGEYAKVGDVARLEDLCRKMATLLKCLPIKHLPSSPYSEAIEEALTEAKEILK